MNYSLERIRLPLLYDAELFTVAAEYKHDEETKRAELKLRTEAERGRAVSLYCSAEIPEISGRQNVSQRQADIETTAESLLELSSFILFNQRLMQANGFMPFSTVNIYINAHHL